GPVFTQEPSDSIFPLSTEDKRVFINCRAKGNPPPHYRWTVDGREISTESDPNYSLAEGNLLIKNPHVVNHRGVYQCIATNTFGTIVSRQAKVQFAFLENFSRKSRSIVSVREGQAVVLLCGPPLHYGEIKYSWVFNGRRGFLQQDARRFISQRTGNLYIAKVEALDAGNYTCAVRNMMTNATVFSSPTPVVVRGDAVMGEYEPKIEVQFPDTLRVSKGSSVTLECFALGNPVPSISWRRADGNPLPGKIKINHSTGVLEIPYFRPEDAGVYECVAENSRGLNVARGQLLFQNVEHLQWVHTPKDADIAIGASLQWECKAMGNPRPAYKWLKNGQILPKEGEIYVEAGKLSITRISLSDSGMYQCVAHNEHGSVYASAELKVVASPPDFTLRPVKKSTVVQRGGEAVLECRPYASPRAVTSWWRGGELLKDTERQTVMDDGTLRITNISKFDGGRYTCVARNHFGTSSSTGTLVVKGPPGPPEALAVTDISDTTVQLSWGSGPDNHSPVTMYMVQAKTPFSIGWQTVATVPKVAPVGVSGGGGARGELVITWEPVSEEHQSGEDFGYIVAFRPAGSSTWIQTVLASPDASRYIYKDDSIEPLTLFEVKVGVYNSIGEGQFSRMVRVFSAEEAPNRPPSNIEWKLTNSKIFLNWEHVKAMENESEVTGYKVVYRQAWNSMTSVLETNKTSMALQIPSGENYLIEIKALTEGGDGSSSGPIRIPKMSRSSILQSPVFTKQPGSIVYPVETLERNKEVVFSCEAQGSPPPSYRWKLNGTEISSKYGSHYILSGGNLRINRLNKDQDAGTYQCLASNSFGTIVSREASLTFAYLENFKTHRRSSVFVREGQGVVLLCGPPPHSGGKTMQSDHDGTCGYTVSGSAVFSPTVQLESTCLNFKAILED
ncbi:unnamed protein product, partial [Tetraodon nigroviridis]